MNRHSGFTLGNLIVLVGVVLLVLFVFSPRFNNPHYGHNEGRILCAGNFKSLYQALNYYADRNSGRFPVAGKPVEGDDGPLHGFDSKLERRATTFKIDPMVLSNNVNATLWMLVRDKSMTVNRFICRTTEDVADPLTLDGSLEGKSAPLEGTADFFARKHLSYSMINMYHPGAPKNWTARANPDWILMADNNNADKAPGLHTRTKLTKLKGVKEIQEGENSRNHAGEGQNFMYADGSVAFSLDPFVGPGGDNVYADDKAAGVGDPELAAPPTMAGNAPQSNPSRNVVLLPLSGNNGVNLDPAGK